jgi:hypothetical protein
MKTVGLPPRKVASILCPVKNDLGLKTAGVYSIPCECGKVYIGQIRHFIETRIKEQHQHIRLQQPDKSAVAKHSIDLSHCIHFQDTRILMNLTLGMHHQGSNTDQAYCDNMNREETFSLSKSWKLLLQTLK